MCFIALFQDSAVHEQKLNFHRAQITELNRRMTALMNSTKRGFPSHENMQIFDSNPAATTTLSSPIRNAIPPKHKNGHIANSQTQVTPQFLLKQNQKLAEVSFPWVYGIIFVTFLTTHRFFRQQIYGTFVKIRKPFLESTIF